MMDGYVPYFPESLRHVSCSLHELVSVRPDDPIRCGLCSSELERVEMDASTTNYICPEHGIRWTFGYAHTNEKFKVGDKVIMHTTGSYITEVTDVRSGEFKDTTGYWWNNEMAHVWDGKPFMTFQNFPAYSARVTSSRPGITGSKEENI